LSLVGNSECNLRRFTSHSQ